MGWFFGLGVGLGFFVGLKGGEVGFWGQFWVRCGGMVLYFGRDGDCGRKTFKSRQKQHMYPARGPIAQLGRAPDS